MNATRRHRSEQRRLLGLRRVVRWTWGASPAARLPVKAGTMPKVAG